MSPMWCCDDVFDDVRQEQMLELIFFINLGRMETELLYIEKQKVTIRFKSPESQKDETQEDQ